MHTRGERILFAIAFILGILAIGSTVLNATGAVVFSRGGSGFGSVGLDSSSIVDLYYKYTQIFDFFLFLIFFIGLSEMILGKHFDAVSMHKGVYVSVGLILALGLVLWEYRTGFNLLEISWPFALLILGAWALLFFFNILKGFNTAGPSAIAATFVVMYITLFILFDVYQVGFIDTIRYYLPFDLFSIMTILFFVAVFILIAKLLTSLFRRSTT